jgi:hypothetical protein
MRGRFFWSISAAGLMLRCGVLVGVMILEWLYQLPM